MAYSDSFPAIRPSFQFSADAGRLDPRISYSRSTTGSFYGKDKHLSSENLIPYSNNVSAAAWTKARLTVDSANNSSPDGGTDASLILETTDTGTHSFYDGFNCVSGQNYSFIFYAKPNGRTKLLFQPQAPGAIASLEFDLAGAGTVTLTSGSTVSHSITQIGDWYKCQATIAATATGVGYTQIYLDNGSGISYAGDVTKGIYAWGNQVSSTSETFLNATSGQIHREYAPTLQTAAINAPRFEYSPTDSASMGLLIEGSSTNLVTRSSELNAAFWNTFTTANIDANVAVSIDGTLTADLIRPTTATSGHYVQTNAAVTTVDASTYTLSAYVKAAGLTKTRLYFIRASSPYTTAAYGLFTLTGDGSVEDVQGSATISPVGNGWYRISVTGAAVTTLTTLVVQPTDASGTATFAGDGYSGIICTGVQFELGSHCSSLVSTSGATATRAADSASMDLTQAGFNGGPFSIVSETEGGQGVYPRAWTLTDGTLDNRLTVYRNSGTATTSTNWFYYGASEASAQVSSSVTGSASAGKLAVSYDTNDVSFCASGGTVTNDTSAVIPKNITTLIFGAQANATANKLNGHVKRIALYGEALSDTNLQALTK